MGRLRASNLNLGTDQPVLISEFQKKFDRKAHRRLTKKQPAAASTNVQIGNQTSDFSTTFKDYFTKKIVKFEAPSQHVKDDHTKTHFKVGTDGKYFKSLAQRSFTKPLNYSAVVTKKHGNGSNFALGIGRGEWGTKYNTAFTPFKKAEKGSSKFNDSKLRQSSFHLGKEGNAYLSEFSRNYYKKKKVNNNLDKKFLRDLQTSHFGFNDVAKSIFQTTSTKHFQNWGSSGKPGFSNGYAGSEGVKRGRKTHFTVGSQAMNFDTQNSRTFDNKKDSKPARLDPRLENNLRTHHFQVKDRESPNRTG